MMLTEVRTSAQKICQISIKVGIIESRRLSEKLIGRTPTVELRKQKPNERTDAVQANRASFSIATTSAPGGYPASISYAVNKY